MWFLLLDIMICAAGAVAAFVIALTTGGFGSWGITILHLFVVVGGLHQL